MWDFPYLNARIRDFKAKGEGGGVGGWGGDLGLKVKMGRGRTKKPSGLRDGSKFGSG